MKRLKGKYSIEDEKGSVEIEEKTSDVLNPLLMDGVAAHMLEWLDVESLKVARQVCILWRREGRKAIVKKCYLQTPSIFHEQPQFRRGNLGEDPKTLKELRKQQQHLKSAFTQFLTPHESLKGLSVKVRREKVLSPFDDVDLFQEFPILNKKCTNLYYDKTDTSGLLDIMENLDNLKILTTSALDLQQQQHVQNIVKKLQSLNELRLESNLTSSLLSSYLSLQTNGENDGKKKPMEILTQPENLWPLNQLKIVGAQSYTPNLLKMLNSSNILQWWSINIIEMTVDTTQPILHYHKFFSTISPSQLKLFVSGSYDMSKTTRPWNEWHLPSPSSCPSLDKSLTSLDLDVEGKPAPTKLWGPFAVSLQFSNLKRLAIKSVSSGYRFDKMVADWNSDDSGQGRRLESKSLEEVDLSTCFNFHLRSLKVSFWPNLKSIKLQLQQPQFFAPYGLSDIFKELTKLRLEQLEFLLLPTEDETSKKTYWEHLLSGTNNDQRKDASENKKSPYFTIMHLPYLKRFALESRCELSEDVGDHFIYNALIHLKNLQSLVIRGHNFSKEGITHLKKKLGPNTCVKLSKE